LNKLFQTSVSIASPEAPVVVVEGGSVSRQAVEEDLNHQFHQHQFNEHNYQHFQHLNQHNLYKLFKGQNSKHHAQQKDSKQHQWNRHHPSYRAGVIVKY
jgi:hypothetical protein